MIPLLEVDGLSFYYGDFQALHQVSFDIAEGQTLALVGANGAGKTTLLRTVAGAAPPLSGRVRFEGVDITDLQPYERIKQGISLVPEGRRLFPSLTAEENILVGAVPSGREPWSLERLYELFPLLVRCRKRSAATLSGGEQQAVAIARALISAPRLLLLDEISLGLAPRVIEDLYAALAGLRATLLLVEQDLDRALSTCDEVVCLLEGRVALAGAADQVSRDDVVSAYFGQVEQ